MYFKRICLFLFRRIVWARDILCAPSAHKDQKVDLEWQWGRKQSCWWWESIPSPVQELSTFANPPQARNAYFLALKNSPAAEPLGLHPSGHPQPTASSPLFTRGSLKRQCKTRQERKKTAPPTQTQALAILRVLEANGRRGLKRRLGRCQSKAPEN